MSIGSSDTPKRWEDYFRQSAQFQAECEVNHYQAGRLLWLGTQQFIKAWDYQSDPSGEVLQRTALAYLGVKRKGTASKIKTVALATRHHELNVDAYGSLNAAYKEAKRMALGVAVFPRPAKCHCGCPNH